MEKINDKYYLGSNKNSYILYEKKITAAGKENYKNVGYISSLEALYSTLIEKEIRTDLTLLNNIARINELIKELKEFTINYIKQKNSEIQ